MADRITEVLYRFRYPLSLLTLVGALALSPRANITEIDNDITAWFSKQDPVVQTYDRFRNEFGGTRNLIVAVRSDRIFSPEGLAFLAEATSEIERVPTVQRVQSLTNANVVQAVEDGIEVKPLVGRAVTTVDEAARARRRALAEPLIRGDLISDDGNVTAIAVTFDEDRIDEVRAGVIDQIRTIVQRRLPPGAEAFFNGSLEISEAYNRITLSNQRTFIPPILALTLLALYATFRSIRKTALCFSAILISLLWTLGTYSLLGFTFNILTSMIPPLVVVIAVADDVHIVQRYEEELCGGLPPEAAFKSTVSHLLTPLFGASATTALGMLSLATSDVKAVRDFGIGSGIGIMMDFAISIVFVPTVLTLMKQEPGRSPHRALLIEPMRRVAALSTRRPALILGTSLAAAAAAMWGIGHLRVDTNHINFFASSHPLSRSATVIDTQLSGIYSFQILLEGPPDSLQSPEILTRMDALERDIARLPYVKKTTSIAQYVKRINQELNEGLPAHAVVPASQQAVAQELFVFALSEDGRRELERLAATDYSRANISVKLASMSSDLVFDQINQADRMAKDAFAGTPVTAEATGSGRLFSTLDHYLVMSQVTSFTTAFVTVFGVIFIVFRSFRFGVLAIVANAVPVLAVLGLMGWLDISLNIATVMVASVALGVVDDDTIHFISRFRYETSHGAQPAAAIETATVHEGRASLTGAFINSLGYGVLMLSEYKPTAWFGMLLAITMAVAFLAEVLIVPAIITLFPRTFAWRK